MHSIFKLFSLKIIILFLVSITSTFSIACDTSPVISVNSNTDNGNGTFDLSLTVCIGDGGSESGFTTSIGGGVNIIAFTPATLSGDGAHVGVGVLAGGVLDYNDIIGTAPANMFVAVNVNTCFNYSITVDSDPGTQTITFVGVNSEHVGSCANSGGNTQTLTIPLPPSPPPPCGSITLDPGGTGNYPNNSNTTYLFCPDVAGDDVTLSFNSFNLEANYDFLQIFDGPDNSFTSLGNFSGNTIPPDLESSHPSGCLTAVFTSDGSVTRAGFSLTVNCNFYLPIELKAFEISCENEISIVNWSSASEYNNKKYLVYGSEKGEIWNLVEEVVGAGNSNSLINYSVKDARNHAYYKLTQEDFDGTVEELGVRLGNNCNNSNKTNLVLYPNPSNGAFSIKGNIQDGSLLIIKDAKGVVILKDIISNNNKSIQLIANPGIYFVHITNTKQDEYSKLVIE